MKAIEFVLVHAPKGKKEETMADLSVNVKETLGFDKTFADMLQLKKKGMLGKDKYAGNLYLSMEVVNPSAGPQQPQQPQQMMAPMMTNNTMPMQQQMPMLQ